MIEPDGTDSERRRARLLEDFRDLLERLDVDRIEADEASDHAERST
jgi:hypothetical protein